VFYTHVFLSEAMLPLRTSVLRHAGVRCEQVSPSVRKNGPGARISPHAARSWVRSARGTHRSTAGMWLRGGFIWPSAVSWPDYVKAVKVG